MDPATRAEGPGRAPFIVRPSRDGRFRGFSVLGLFTAVSPTFLAQGLSVKSHAVVGLVVFVVFAASAAGQMLLGRFPNPMSVGCGTLIAGMALLALGLALSSLALLVLAGIAAGLGQGSASAPGSTR